MKLSDEIRKWCDDAYSGRKIRTTKDLYAIADLIDREMVELPKDKDGEHIHVGDKVYLDDGRMACVTSIEINDVCEVVDCWDGGKHVAYHPSGISHTRHDSWERIADDLDEIVDAADSADDTCEMLANFANRIRKLAAKEDGR
ncbi:MAG: hypothetical protein PUE29_10330 [Olsenella sp.]|nr:hypothetical protein [Olsenella sp.]